MKGGEPAGIFISSSESGDLANRVKITMTTRHGNSKTKASGIEREDSPNSRIRRSRKPVRGAIFAARRGASLASSALSLEFGIRRVTSCLSAIGLDRTAAREP